MRNSNAWGRDGKTNDVVGVLHVGRVNESGEWFLEICVQTVLAVGKLLFGKRDNHEKTWIRKVMKECMGKLMMTFR